MISTNSTILVNTVSVPDAAYRYILSRTPRTAYSDAEVASIIYMYRESCRTGSVDLLLALAQMCHETGALTSVWSQPPHRNPAGIGVTGAPGVGQSFDSWIDAVQAHVGLLLAYRFPAGEGSDAQKRLINMLLSYRPSAPRGVAVTVGEMASRWAADSTYVTRLEAMAAAILRA